MFALIKILFLWSPVLDFVCPQKIPDVPQIGTKPADANQVWVPGLIFKVSGLSCLWRFDRAGSLSRLLSLWQQTPCFWPSLAPDQRLAHLSKAPVDFATSYQRSLKLSKIVEVIEGLRRVCEGCEGLRRVCDSFNWFVKLRSVLD